MTLDFNKLKMAVQKQFDNMVKHDLFRADIEKDMLWLTYIESFPKGTNPIYRERTEHDCSCCKHFIRAVGDAVAIIEGQVVSVWDIQIDDPAYQTVANAMAKYVKEHKIKDAFLHYERTVGIDQNYEDDKGKVVTWKHFHVNIPYGRNIGKNYYCDKAERPTKLSQMRSTHDVFARGLKELTLDAVDTVLDIISQNSLYRGGEYKFNLDEFAKHKRVYDTLKTDQERENYAWVNYDKLNGAAANIRNTAIGTLLIDLSEGTDLEPAVKKFETSIMAPSNYKRPTALVSQKMVDNAKADIEKLGLSSALERRYAKLADISVNDIVFADREARTVMQGAFDNIANMPAKPKDLSKIETVSIDKFISDIVPNVASIEVFVENKHTPNLVSLIAPLHRESKPLFKWNNGFSWAYNGDVADSIKERVKRAGGNVVGDLCCRLAWYNYDDLDFHMKEVGGHEIFFVNKGMLSPNGGMLDVDMNAGSGHTRLPVENIFYKNRRAMKEGKYHLFVHQYCHRDTSDPGFEVELDFMGDVKQYHYNKPMRHGEVVTVAKVKYSHANGIEVLESLPESSASKSVWGVKTQDFQKVNVLMLSPNHWEGETGVGNKHYFFMLDKCVNDGAARGFFNEFLRPEIDAHRKVLEIVGGKMKVLQTDHQLSGLGFSDSKRAEVLVRVKGNFTRTLRVTI